MEAAGTAISKLLSGSGQKDTTVETEVAPAVQHETIEKEHETREQTVVDREKHQHHYQTVVQPLEDQEVKATKHDHEVAPTQHREVNKDDGEAVKADVDAQQAAFQNTTEEGKTKETFTDEGTVVGEQVHHHLHQTIQPVIEKETIESSVTHKVVPVKEVIQEQSQNHGVTTKPAMSVDEFKHSLTGETTVTSVQEGAVQEAAVGLESK